MAPFTDTDSDDRNGLGSEEGTMYTQLAATVTRGRDPDLLLIASSLDKQLEASATPPLATRAGEPLAGGNTLAPSPSDPALISHFCVHI